MLPQDTQEFKGWQRIFKAGLEAGFKGIQLQEGAQIAAEIEARRLAAEAREAAEAQRRQTELNRTLPPAGANVSDDGLWLV